MYQQNNLNEIYSQNGHGVNPYVQLRQASPWDQFVPLRQIHPWDRYGLPCRVHTWDEFDQRRWKQVQEQYKQQYLAQMQVRAQERLRRQKEEKHERMLQRRRTIRKSLAIGAGAMCVALLLFAVYSLMRWGFGYDVMDRSGWREAKDGSMKYRDYHGKLVKGWQTLEDGKLYYFSDKGVLQTGWFTVDGQRYYWDEGKTGWVTIDGKDYYINADLSQRLGWIDRGGEKYYYYDDGTISTGWVDIDGQDYYFSDTGVMQTGWLEWEGDRYYLRDDGRMAKGQINIDGVNHFFTSTGKYVLLVNKSNAVPAGYDPGLVDYAGFLVASECRDALDQMVTDGRNSGVRCTIDNIYRSESDQNYLWWQKFHSLQAEGYSYDDATATTDTSLMRPGHSEHHTGLAVDFVADQADTLAWMGEHCWDYGYIVRYPDGKSHVTDIIYEPWHFRYVGVELAQELRSSGLCLEEYMQMLTEENNP